MLLIPLIMAVVMLFASLGFGVWAFAERQDYKDNFDEKTKTAVAVAVEKANSEKDNEFLQREKEPLKSYSGPTQLGSIIMKYPKTWSAYSTEQATSLNIIMQPDMVSSAAGTANALRVEVLSTAYNAAVASSDGLVKQGKLTASAYSFPKVPGVVGLKFVGEVSAGKTGAVVFMPLRDKTIKLTVDSNDRVADFNNIILPNFQFTP